MSRLNELKGAFAPTIENYPSRTEKIRQELERVSILVPNLNWEQDQWGNLYVDKEDSPCHIYDTPEEVYIERGPGLGTDLHFISGRGHGFVLKGIVQSRVYSSMIQPVDITEE